MDKVCPSCQWHTIPQHSKSKVCHMCNGNVERSLEYKWFKLCVRAGLIFWTCVGLVCLVAAL